MRRAHHLLYDDESAAAADGRLRKAPRRHLPAMPMPPSTAYRIVHDEAMLDGNPRLNLASFVTDRMDDYADELMRENMGKNLIDRSQYPQSSRMEQRCIDILADLWHSPEKSECTGTSTIGSSEACILGGLSALLRRRAGAGFSGTPNFVIGAAHQVIWDKFAGYWGLEMRTVPLTAARPTLDAVRAAELCDENTFLAVAVECVAATGLNDDVDRLNRELERLHTRKGYDIGIHVDAASGGFLLPFLQPARKWDFRLRRVNSINVSAHKYGLVYSGLGWIVWRGKEFLPESMRFEDRYSGRHDISPSINFTKPANRVLAQYYQFLRLGFDGFRELQQGCMEVAEHIRSRLGRLGFAPLADRLEAPIVAWSLIADVNRKWTLYDLSDAMRAEGWLIPVYALPERLSDTVIMRVVVRHGMGVDMADLLLRDLKRCCDALDSRLSPTRSYDDMARRIPVEPRNFSH